MATAGVWSSDAQRLHSTAERVAPRVLASPSQIARKGVVGAWSWDAREIRLTAERVALRVPASRSQIAQSVTVGVWSWDAREIRSLGTTPGTLPQLRESLDRLSALD